MIEDDPAISAALDKDLQAEGYQVAVAARGDDGLARAREHHFDVVLTDLRMPGLSGLELVSQLHSAKPKLPIIMMTGSILGAEEQAICEEYDFPVLRKPFLATDVMNQIRARIGGKAKSGR